jgi:hypothetical protein
MTSILPHMNLVHFITPYFFKIRVNIILLSTTKSIKWSLLSDFKTQILYAILTSYMTCPFHMIQTEYLVVVLVNTHCMGCVAFPNWPLVVTDKNSEGYCSTCRYRINYVCTKHGA